ETRRKDPPESPAAPSVPVVSLPDAPVSVPLTIPPVDSALVVDTFSVLRTRLSVPLGSVQIEAGTPDYSQVMEERAVDERPEVLRGFQPEFPDLLRQAGIEGTVIIEVVIDTLGQAEPASVRIVQSSNRAFDISAREAVLRTVYRPGRVRGRAVRVL